MINGSIAGDIRKPLRFGILCNGLSFPAWQARCIQQLLAGKGIEPVLLIIDDTAKPRVSLWQRARRLLTRKTFLWRIYELAVLNRASRSSRPVDLTAELGSLPILRCQVEHVGKYTQRFFREDVATINGYGLDFVLRFAFNIIRGEILTTPRYGVWSFHHDDPDKYRGTPPGFWEIYKDDSLTGAILQRLTDRLDAGIVLHRGFFKTIPFSYPKNLDTVLFGSTDWPARVCADIQNGNATYLAAVPYPTEAPIYHEPSDLQMVRFGWITAKAWLQNQLHSLFRHQQWNVGIIDCPIHEVVHLAEDYSVVVAPKTVRWLNEVPGRFFADPFAVGRHEDSTDAMTLLVEEFSWSREKGHISIIESHDGRTFSAPHLAIKTPHHLSYPFLFEFDGNTYCVPESYEAQQVALYSAGTSLREWSKVGTLVSNIPAVDPTVFKYNGYWWLFCTSEDAGPNEKLFAWFAEGLTGPWMPHAANPLKTDVRSSRPAGRPFEHDGQLYRPAQDCSSGYGSAVVVNRINRLTPVEFSEEVASVLLPNPTSRYSKGLHTVCSNGKYTVIDGARTTFVPQAFVGSISRKLTRFARRHRD